MSTQYKIFQLDYAPDGSILAIHWRAFLQEQHHIAFRSGAFGVDAESKDLQMLDEEAMIAWLKTKIDIESIENNLLSQIEEKKNAYFSSQTPTQ